MFQVFWNDAAKARLADIRVGAPDRSAVTAAVESIDRRLRADPLTFGESRAADERIRFVPRWS